MNSLVGDRIKFCRNLLGMTRQEFVLKIGDISPATLERWEYNKIIPSKLKLKQLVCFFNEHNLSVSIEWLIEGIGVSPLNKISHESSYNFDEYTYITLDRLKQYIPNFTILMCNSNNYAPLINFGDYIGVVFTKKNDKLNNKLCCILKDNILFFGIYTTHIDSLRDLENNMIEVENSEIGEILWISKRY